MVYEYKCSNNKSIEHIGFTSRPLIERVKEHLKGKTAVFDHISNCFVCKNERITVNNFGILKECRNKLKTLISEAILIQHYNPILNKQLTKPGITHTLRIFLFALHIKHSESISQKSCILSTVYKPTKHTYVLAVMGI